MNKFIFDEPRLTRSNYAASDLTSSTLNTSYSSHSNRNNKSKHGTSAGFFRQLGVLMLKNLLIIRSSFIQFTFEIVLSISFILMLLVVRNFVERILVHEQPNSAYNVIDFFYKYIGQDTIMFYPDTPVVRNIISRAFLFIKTQKYWLSLFTTGTNISDPRLLDYDTAQRLVAFIAFPADYDVNITSNSDIVYSITMREQPNLNYNIKQNLYSKQEYMLKTAPEGLCQNHKDFLMYNIFNSVKLAIDLSVIQEVSHVAITDPRQIKIQQLDCPDYYNDELKASFDFIVPLIIQIAYLFTLLINLGDIVAEKRTKMREYLSIVGVRNSAYWLNSMLRSFLVYQVLTVLIVIVTRVQLSPRLADIKSTDPFTTVSLNDKRILDNLDPWITFGIFMVYSIQVSLFTLLLSQFFQKPLIAKIVAILIWILTAIDFYGNISPDGIKYLFCFFPNLGLLFAFQVVYQYERSNKMLSFSDLFVNLFHGTSINLGSVLLFMLGWSLFYIPLIWYLEKIMPKQFGISQPFYFIFQPSYWLAKWNSSRLNEPIPETNVSEESLSTSFEPEDRTKVPTVSMKSVTKVYKSRFKSKNAVNNLTLNLYENQITGLLGHNGAGKSTAIFMMCGIFPPSSGSITVYNNNIKTNLAHIRSFIGFCPQQSILYDELTVYDHLNLIASLKGFSSHLLANEIERTSLMVGLNGELRKAAKNLSGGMKKRLSIAMALVGDSKIIILDEPSSGLDPLNRRLLWNILKEHKKNRTIVFTSHYMEEVDVLCDRIGIMNGGQLKCYGSPNFLKSNFGRGYRIGVIKNSNFNSQVFKNIVELFDFDYIVETDIAAEITLILPSVSVYNMIELIRAIEENKTYIGINSFSIGSTTIEQVFFKCGQQSKREPESDEKPGVLESNITNESIVENDKLISVFNKSVKLKQGMSLVVQQFKALVLKRLWILFRRYFLAALILGLPPLLELFFTLLIPSQTYLINESNQKLEFSGKYELGINNYGPFRLPYFLNGSFSTQPIISLLRNFYDPANRPYVTLVELGDDDVPGFILNHRNQDINTLASDFYIGMSLNITGVDKFYSTLYYSTMAFHSSANAINEMTNMYLAFLTNNFSRRIVTYNMPLKSNDSLYYGDEFIKYLGCLDILPVSFFNMLNSLIVVIQIGLIVITVGRERISGSKSLQLLTGTRTLIYWISNYVFDVFILIFNFVSMIVVFKIIDLARNDPTNETRPLAEDQNIGYVFLLFIVAAFPGCSIAYIWSFFFKTELVGFIVLAILLGVASFVDMLFSFVLLFNNIDNNLLNTDTAVFDLMTYLKLFLTILFPNVTVKRGLYNLKVRKNVYCINSMNRVFNTNYVSNQPALSFVEPGIAQVLMILLGQFIVFNLILYFLEVRNRLSYKRACKWIRSKLNSITNRVTPYPHVFHLDSDVRNEAKRIESSDLSIQEDPLVIRNLTKVYKRGCRKRQVAVNNLCVGVSRGECFGILGLNGAGKTTLIKMLIGETTPTSGNVFIGGIDLHKDFSKARQNLGYCPQFSYLPEFLIVEECLELFSDLKGVYSSFKYNIIEDLIRLFRLDEFRKKMVKHLSEGNKKKLSAALAFIGKPKVVILDEPTTGMDPASRRYFWELIRKASNFGITTLLSTHSMQECEVLCSRLVIMTRGIIRCIGSSQHIKNKYSKELIITVKCKRSEVEDEARRVNTYGSLSTLKFASLYQPKDVVLLDEFLTKNVPNSYVQDRQLETLFIHVDNREHKLNHKQRQTISDLFFILDSIKYRFNIETFSISEPTLEQVFFMFTGNKAESGYRYSRQ